MFKLPGSAHDFSVLVAGNFDDLDDEVRAFRQALIGSLVLLGIGLLLAIFVQVRFGLKPLNVMQRNLADIRVGRAEQLKGEYPAELQPVAEELNLLLQSNVEVVERARTQVGNLAHALKTPLSVLTNEAAGQKNPLSLKVIEQVELMRNQVNLYLDRARRAARAQGLGAVTDVISEDLGNSSTAKRVFALADPVESARLVHEWTLAPPDGLQGIIWYRLPVEGDRRNWPWDTFERVIRGEVVLSAPELEVSNGTGPRDLFIINRGKFPVCLPREIVIEHPILAADGAGAYRLESQSDGLRLTRRTDIWPWLNPGKRIPSGWLRFREEPARIMSHFKP